jgi:probable selenium-dependent hydroxylase accessory protein YqeC
MGTLREYLRLTGGGVISLVGAGGKTTLMFRIAGELAEAGETVLTTTTTKIYVPSPEQSPQVIVSPAAKEVLEQARAVLSGRLHVTAASGHVGGGEKLAGFPPEVLDEIWRSGLFRWIAVEADGAAGRSLKVPAPHEPVIPTSSGWIVAVVGLDVVGMPLDERWVFRSPFYSRITGLPPGRPVTADSIAAALLHEDGIMRGSPSTARRYVYLNKADDPRRLESGRYLAAALSTKAKGALHGVLIGAANSAAPVLEQI